MTQQYVLDYAYSMNGLDPFTLPMPTGWVTIINLQINGQTPSGSPPAVTVPANQQFYLTYDIVVSSSVPLGQHGWGDIVYTGTSNQITEANSVWSNINMGPGTYSVSINFTNGISTQMNYTLRVGHVEYTLTAQPNNASYGSVAVTNPTPPPSSWYVGQVATLTATPAGGSTFQNWTKGGSIIGTNTILNYTMAAEDTTIIGNFSYAGAPVCDAGGPYSAQVNQVIQFQGTASGGTSPYSYVWNFGDGSYAYVEDPTHAFTTTGTKTITLTVTDALSQTCIDTTTAIISSAPVPITCSAGADQNGVINTAVTFTGTASGGMGSLTYTWDFSDGGSYIGNPAQHTFTAAGTYTATLTVTDGISTPCSDTAYAVITGGGCSTGEIECINGEKWVCINGVWNNTYQPCCNLNDIKCQDEQVYICDNNNNWMPSGVICCVPDTQKCVNGFWNTCNQTGDGWVPSQFQCAQDIPTEYIIIGGIAVVGGLVALAAASGGLGGYTLGRRRRK